ncbi:hypothetical protein [Streptomyces sp. NPDC057694]|uniref:hypothetical protein n=1 Tax=Streptomyces sp. NPDC057694 TaxID=3346216 RepID=UPI0036A43A64
MTVTTHTTGPTATTAFRWDWYQRARAPGVELLGSLTGARLAEVGAGSARQAAHLAVTTDAARVVALDQDPAQHQRGRERYGTCPVSS